MTDCYSLLPGVLWRSTVRGLQDAAEDEGPPQHQLGMQDAVYDDSFMAQHHPPTFAVLEGQGQVAREVVVAKTS